MKNNLGIFNWNIIFQFFGKAILTVGAIVLSGHIVSSPAFWEGLLARENRVACLELQELSKSDDIRFFFVSREVQDTCKKIGINMANGTPFTQEKAYEKFDTERTFPQV